jgi:hypothetical protein
MGNAAYAKGKHFDWLLSGPKSAVYNAPGWTCRHQQGITPLSGAKAPEQR